LSVDFYYELNDSLSADPVVYCIDDTKYDGSFPSIMGFVSGDACRVLQTRTKEERQKILADYYAFALKIKEPPIAYMEKNWCDEPWYERTMHL
jgi:monoamine oxidase